LARPILPLPPALQLGLLDQKTTPPGPVLDATVGGLDAPDVAAVEARVVEVVGPRVVVVAAAEVVAVPVAPVLLLLFEHAARGIEIKPAMGTTLSDRNRRSRLEAGNRRPFELPYIFAPPALPL
jgi:hypothetical protein